LEEIAGAIAFIAWKIALDKAINLHGENFVYHSDRQRVDVITEYLCFQVQLVDRITFTTLDAEGRRTLITRLALRLGAYLQDNGEELFGPGDYRGAFIERLNQRATEYAELGYTDDGPSYPFLRLLGYEIQGIMGREEGNRWVIDQVMDRDGPEVHDQLKRAVRDLFE
jgi:hypothetical protein